MDTPYFIPVYFMRLHKATENRTEECLTKLAGFSRQSACDPWWERLPGHYATETASTNRSSLFFTLLTRVDTGYAIVNSSL